VEQAEMVRFLAGKADDPGLAAQASALMGRAMMALGQIEQGRSVLDQAFQAAERTHNAEAIRITVIGNAGTAALLGEPESAIRWAARYSGDAPNPQILGETDLAVAVALALLQRGAVTEAGSHLQWLDTVPGQANHNARAIEAVIAAASGDLALARRRSDEVIGRTAATYIDQTFAHLALAAVHRRNDDLDACERAINEARMCSAGTDDVLMPLIVSMAEAVFGLGNLPHTEVRFRGLGLEPEGWRHAWSHAVAGGAVYA